MKRTDNHQVQIPSSKTRRTVLLTDVFCKNAPAGDWRDAGASGLILRVGGSDPAKKKPARSWAVRYSRKSDKKQRRHSLGLLQDLKLADARVAAGEIMRRVRAGEDPAGEAEARRVGLTFTELVEAYFERNTALAENTRALYAQYLRSADVADAIGKMPPAKITKGMIRDIVDRIERRGAAVAADKARIAISSVFAWGIESGAVKMLEDNPARGIAMRSTHEPRRRPWTPLELATIWRALNEDATEATADIIKLLALTACRRTEVVAATVAEFDLENARWTIPGKSRGKKGAVKRGRTKSQNEKVVALAPLALEIIRSAMARSSAAVQKIEDIEARSARQDYLFPSHANSWMPHLDPHSITRAIARIAKSHAIEDLHLHDLRTTCRTWMRGAGISTDVRDAALGHKGETVGERVYEGADINFIEIRVRPAMNQWAKHVAAIVGG